MALSDNLVAAYKFSNGALTTDSECLKVAQKEIEADLNKK